MIRGHVCSMLLCLWVGLVGQDWIRLVISNQRHLVGRMGPCKEG